MADRRENDSNRVISHVRVLSPEEQAHEMAQWEHDPNWPAMENRGSATTSMRRKTGEYAKSQANWAKKWGVASRASSNKPVKIDSSKTMLGKEI